MAGTRVHPRYALEIDAEIAVAGRRLPARTRDLSRGGLSILARAPLPVGEDVTAEVSLAFEDRLMSDPLVLRGRVVWCTPVDGGLHQVGIAFVGLTGDQRVYLELFLRYLEDA